MKSLHTSNSKQHFNPIRTPYIIMVSFLCLFVIAGCDSSTDSNQFNGNGNGDPPPQPPPQGENEIFMEPSAFVPGDHTVESGTTVTWTNTNSIAHTVTSGEDGDHDDLFDSGDMSPGDDFTHTFEEEGTFNYYCTFHWQSGMTGTITVTGNGDNDNSQENSGGISNSSINGSVY